MGSCVFEATSNMDAVTKLTSMSMLRSTSAWSPTATVELVAHVLAVMLAPCLCLGCVGCFVWWRRTPRAGYTYLKEAEAPSNNFIEATAPMDVTRVNGGMGFPRKASRNFFA